MDRTKFVIIAAILIMFLLALTIIYFVFYYRNKQIRLKLEQQREMEKVRREMERKMLENSLELQELVRKEIAKDLHDEIGGLLSATKMSLFALSKKINENEEFHQKFQASRSLVDESLQQVRRLSSELVPRTLYNFGLVSALEEFIQKMQSATSMQFHLDIVGFEPEMRFSPNIELGVYRVIQELSNNSIKHSNSKCILIGLILENDEQLSVEFVDDGIGYNFEESLTNSNSGLGLTNILSRLSILNANKEFNSIKGEGSTFKFSMKI